MFEAFASSLNRFEAALHCPVCNGIYDDPHILGECGHCFCRECAVHTIAGNGKCYKCNLPAAVRNMHRNPAFSNIVDALKRFRGKELNAGIAGENANETDAEAELNIKESTAKPATRANMSIGEPSGKVGRSQRKQQRQQQSADIQIQTKRPPTKSIVVELRAPEKPKTKDSAKCTNQSAQTINKSKRNLSKFPTESTSDVEKINPIGNDTAVPDPKPHLVFTGLSEAHKQILRDISKQQALDYAVDKSVGGRTTHVIASVNGRQRLCTRTMKYLEGILHRCWLVSFEWLLQSVSEGRWVAEREFLLEGDTTSGVTNIPRFIRSVSCNQPLFEGCVFDLTRYLEETLSTDDLLRLISSGGGTVTLSIVKGTKRKKRAGEVYFITADSFPPSTGSHIAVSSFLHSISTYTFQ